MDHDAAREQLELAAAEPGGLERLMAGDTPAAQAVAAHLAGCPACTDELARLERAASVIGQVVREQPPADLRERTLAAVRAAGVRRGVSLAGEAVVPLGAAASIPMGAAAGTATAAGVAAGTTTAAAVAPRATGGGGRSALGWVAAIAAAVTVSVIATSIIVGGQVDQRLAAQADKIEVLERVTGATLQVTAEPDARRVALTTVGGGPAAAASLVFSPSTTELVVVANGLTPPPAGQEYRCWVELAGDREGVGKMFFSDDLAYWIGPVEAVGGLVGDARFGVTLVTLDGSADGQDVLEGDL